MRLFVSFSSPDHQIATRITETLSARQPTLEIYLAPRRNELGAYWIGRLDDELQAADAVLLLLGRRVGTWQELEYYEALRRNRQNGKPLIAPLLLVDEAPGLPFLEQFHRIVSRNQGFDETIERISQALSGATPGETPPPWRVVNPYRGLLAMETQDAAFFFGRENLTAQILNRIADHGHRVLALVGSSGVGKSSVAMAGVLSSLKSRMWPGDTSFQWPEHLAKSHTWPIVIVRPGTRPIKAIAQACAAQWLESPASIEGEALEWERLLMGNSSMSALIDALLAQVARQAGAEEPERVVLYVDQGEELYSRADPEQAQRFSVLLAETAATDRLVAMVSLRSDYYGRLQGDAALFGVASPVDVAPLDRDGIERVIEQPALRLGARFQDDEIVGHLAEATVREPGSMPLLSDLLADTWSQMAAESESRGTLRIPLSGADVSHHLAEKAERFFRAHAAEEDVLRRLVTVKLALVPKDGEVLRRRAKQDECTAEEWRLIETLSSQEWRLVTTGIEAGEPVAEVAHEALLRHWPRLTRWLDESREFLIWKAQFEADRHAWEDAREIDSPRALLTGLRLDTAIRWRRERPDDLSAVDKTFVDSSERAVETAEAREREAARTLANQRAWIQRLSISALAVVTAIAIFALWQWRGATQAEQAALAARDDARNQSALADARRLAMAADGVLNQNAGETEFAGLLATRSLQRHATPEGRRVLRRVLSYLPGERQSLATPRPWSTVHFSPDGKLMALAHQSSDAGAETPAAGMVSVMNPDTLAQVASYQHEGRIWPVVSSDGQYMAVAGYGRRLQVFRNGREIKLLDVPQDDVFDAAFGPESGTLYVARTDGIVEVREAPEWQITGRLHYPLPNHRRLSSVRIASNPAGRQLLVFGQTARAGSLNPWLLSIDGGTPLPLGEKRALVAKFAPSGDQVVTATWDDEVQVWDTTHARLLHVHEHDSRVTDIATSPTRAVFATSTRAGAIVVRDLTGGAIQHAMAHKAWVNDLDISPDGQFLASGSDDNTAAVWDLRTGSRVLSIAHGDEVWSVAFATDMDSLLHGGKDGTLRLTDLSTGGELQRAQYPAGVLQIVQSEAPELVAVSLRSTENRQGWVDLTVVDRASGESVAQIQHNGGFWDTAFSPDGRRLATSTTGKLEVSIWDTATGELKAKPGINADFLRFTPDGERLIAAETYREAFIVDAETGELLATLGEPGGVEAVALPAGTHNAVTFGQDGEFRAWNAVTGEELWSRAVGKPHSRHLYLNNDGSRYIDAWADGKTVSVGEPRSGRVLATIPLPDRSNVILSRAGTGVLGLSRPLTDPENPNSRYTEISFWHVDSGKRLWTRRLNYGSVRIEALTNNRIGILALYGGASAGAVEVIDGENGESLWSATFELPPLALAATSGGGGIAAIGKAQGYELRVLSTGQHLADAPHGSVRSMAANPAGSFVAVGGYQTVHIWDLKNRELQHHLEVQGSVVDLKPSLDGQLLFAAENSEARNGIVVWDTSDWTERAFIDVGASIREVHPLPVPDLIAVYDNSDALRVWHISTGEERHRLTHTSTASGVTLANEESRAVTWREGSIRVWDSRTGNELAHRLTDGDVMRVAISPDGRTVSYYTNRPRDGRRGGEFQALAVWEPDRPEEPLTMPMSTLRGLAFDPSGLFLVVHVAGNALRILKASTLQTEASIRALDGASISGFDFSADGKLLFVHESKNQMYGRRVFEVATGEEIARIDGLGLRKPTPEGAGLASRDGDGLWQIWDPRSARSDDIVWAVDGSGIRFRNDAHPRRILVPASRALPGAALKRLGDALILIPKVRGEPLNVWASAPERGVLAAHTDSGMTINSIEESGIQLAIWPNAKLEGAGIRVGPQFRQIRDVEFADDGAALVAFDTVDFDRPGMMSRLWWWRWEDQPPELISSGNPIDMIAVSPVGSLFATAEGHTTYDSDTGTYHPRGEPRVRLWNAQSGNEVHNIAMEADVDAVAFSPDGRYLAARMVKSVVVFDVEDGSEISRFEFAGTRLRTGGSVSFALEGDRIVANTTGGVQLWSLDGADGAVLRHGRQFPRYITSSNGALIATFSRNTLRIWDAKSGNEVFALEAEAFPYRDFVFLDSTDDLVAIGADGLWRIRWKSDELIGEACRRIRRNMEPDEWQRFMNDEPMETICEG